MLPSELADCLAQLNQELAQARTSRAEYDRLATEAQDESYAQQSEQARHAWVMQATRYRAQAVSAARRVHELVQEIAALEAGPAPVAATAQQAAAQDDTFNFHGEAA